MTIDRHIEELRAELKASCEAGEIAMIESELDAALAQRSRLETEVDASVLAMR